MLNLIRIGKVLDVPGKNIPAQCNCGHSNVQGISPDRLRHDLSVDQDPSKNYHRLGHCKNRDAPDKTQGFFTLRVTGVRQLRHDFVRKNDLVPRTLRLPPLKACLFSIQALYVVSLGDARADITCFQINPCHNQLIIAYSRLPCSIRAGEPIVWYVIIEAMGSIALRLRALPFGQCHSRLCELWMCPIRAGDCTIGA